MAIIYLYLSSNRNLHQPDFYFNNFISLINIANWEMNEWCLESWLNVTCREVLRSVRSVAIFKPLH